MPHRFSSTQPPFHLGPFLHFLASKYVRSYLVLPYRHLSRFKVLSTAFNSCTSYSHLSAPVTLHCTSFRLQSATSCDDCLYLFYHPPQACTLFDTYVLHSYTQHVQTTSKPSESIYHSSSLSSHLCVSLPFSSLYSSWPLSTHSLITSFP